MTGSRKNKTYVLGMFPYPSGEGLHVGHVRIYTAVDVMARYFRMKSFDDAQDKVEVMCPMGWDAFGLPAENAAIKAKTNPKEIVPKNYANFRRQMEDLSFNFDWEHEFATTDPTYYGLTQWIFLELYKKGLVYREQVAINWCPKCLTGLANEEVLADGTHERCGEATSKKELPQWVMRITDYAEPLLADLDLDLGVKEPKLDKSRSALDWPRGILEMQRNWIGKKEGIEIKYEVVDYKETISAFTTTPVNFGASFMVVAPEHELVKKIIAGEIEVEEKGEVEKYAKESQKKSEIDRMVEGREKSGVFTGLYVMNHVTNKKIPVWVADFVLAHVGTGAVQGCPGHDMRDFEFARKFEIAIPRVVVGVDGDESEISTPEQVIERGTKGTMVNSGFLDGVDFVEAMPKTMDYFEEKGWGKRVTTWHLRDWVFSRQRYWGEPIPLVHCKKCGVVPLSEKELPLELPDLKSYEPTDTGESPLVRVKDWVNTKCPSCNGDAKRETDTMPNWAGSCWYHLAFAFWSKETEKTIAGYKKKSKTPMSDFWSEVAKPSINKWLPVDWYLGGAEHAVLHLLYARFWNKVLHDLGHVDFLEPYLRLRSVGMVGAEDGRKMSKSWGNVINPDDVVKEYGSDALRLYEMFMGPWDQAIGWDTRALVGMKRFAERVIKTVDDESLVGSSTSPELAFSLSSLIEKVGKGITDQKFNTSIASMMELVNLWRNSDLEMSRIDVQKFAQVMSPFAPKLAQNVWEKVGGEGKVEESSWPVMEVAEIEVPVTIAVQVAGKLRATIEVIKSESENEKLVVEKVMKDERVKKWVSAQGGSDSVRKVIFVPGKLVNLVV